MIIDKFLNMQLTGKGFTLLLCVTFGALLSGCGGGEEKVKTASALEIAVTPVTRQDVSIMSEFVGQTKGAVDAEVRARVEGIVQQIHFAEGTEVKEGQLLYSIDQAPYKAKLAESKGRLAEAETLLTKAESDLKRIRPLAEMNAVSKKDLDAAIAQEGSARGGVEAARAAVESSEIELGYTQVTAPVSGLIGLSKAKVGEFVGKAPNPVVLNTVSQLDPIHVRFSVNEKEYLYFARQRAKNEGTGPPKRKLELILADGSKHIHIGEVASAESQIDPNTGTLTVEAAFPNAEKILRPGQFAKIRTTLETRTGALVIPKRAIRDLQGQSQVFVVNSDNSVEQKTVQIGPQVGDLQVIEEGLTEKEVIAVEGLQRLKTGMVIAPKVVS